MTSRGSISLPRLFAAVTTLGLAWLVTPVPAVAQNAYITNESDGTVSVIATAHNTVVGTIKVGSAPIGVAVTADGSKVYVANTGDNPYRSSTPQKIIPWSRRSTSANPSPAA
jgi:YVTN family beta-propeller protein